MTAVLPAPMHEMAAEASVSRTLAAPTLESLSDLLDAFDRDSPNGTLDVITEAACGCWPSLLGDASAEAGGVQPARPELAARVLGGASAALGGRGTAAPLSARSSVAVVAAARAWLATDALEVVARALAQKELSGGLRPELAAAAVRWLCSLPEQLSLVCSRASKQHGSEELAEWLDTGYTERLATALFDAWSPRENTDHSNSSNNESHSNSNNQSNNSNSNNTNSSNTSDNNSNIIDTNSNNNTTSNNNNNNNNISNNSSSNSNALELIARLVLRGGAVCMASRLCAAALRSAAGAAAAADVVGRLAEEHSSACCNLVCAVLQASSALLQVRRGGSSDAADGPQLLAASSQALQLLPLLLRPSLGPGQPLQHLLADRLWRLRLGGELPPAVLFAVVDLLRAGVAWPKVRLQWLQRWADEGLLEVADVAADRCLALRLARSLGSGDLEGDGTHLLLQGVHLRLSAQSTESRSFGMALAEAMARRWPRQEAQLCFDSFEREAIGLLGFRLADATYQLMSSEDGLACFLPVAGEDDPWAAARALRALLCPSRAEVELPAAELPAVVSASSPLVKVRAASPPPIASDGDSDDEEEDHPLRGSAPLSPLQGPPDACADLLLVQPPKFLRSAFEMLLGPSKDGITPLSKEEVTSSAAAPELPS
ncbi:unnamed protein product, partial [Polarella glacialis]